MRSRVNLPPMSGARLVVFLLAFSSFACLLGPFYGLWTMRTFGMCELPPAPRRCSSSWYGGAATTRPA
jgi:hypothetical protein